MLAPFRMCNLQKMLDARNARTSEIASNWNVSGTQKIKLPEREPNHDESMKSHASQKNSLGVTPISGTVEIAASYGNNCSQW